MSDNREQILQRLEVILGNLTGMKVVDRMRIVTSDDQLPAAIIYDGSEETDDSDPRERGPQAPRRVTMMPEIYIAFGGDGVGPVMNIARSELVGLVLADATLQGLVINGTQMFYLGCETQIAQGHELFWEMKINFAFEYLLRPDQL